MQATVGVAGPDVAAVPVGAVAVAKAQTHQIQTSPVSTTNVGDTAVIVIVDARMIGPVLLSILSLIWPNIM